VTKQFIEFLKQYGIIGLAIAVIIGGKLNDLISSIVNDLVIPVILNPLLKAAQVDDVKKLNFEGIYYGKVLGAFIDFIIVALVVFFFAKLVLREEKFLIKK
jgi:large conductance mechanosensitive channel